MSALRIVIIGEGGVGKSCITLQFINDSFVEEYEPTMEGKRRRSLLPSGVFFVSCFQLCFGVFFYLHSLTHATFLQRLIANNLLLTKKR